MWHRQDRSNYPKFTLTPRGILAHVPVVHSDAWLSFVDISCEDTHNGTRVLLVLDRRPSGASWRVSPGLDAGEWPGAWSKHAIVGVDAASLPPQKKWKWVDVHLSPRPAFRANPAHDVRMQLARLNADAAVPFRLRASSLDVVGRAGLSLYAVVGVSLPAHVQLSQTRVLFDSKHHCVSLVLGWCGRRPYLHESDGGAHYALVRQFKTHDGVGDPSRMQTWVDHVCAVDHVRAWDGQTKSFSGGTLGSGRTTFRLAISFRVSPLDRTGETLEFRIDECTVESLTEPAEH